MNISLVKKDKFINIKLIVIATIVGLLNSFFYHSFSIMIGLCFVEVAILFWYCLRDDFVNFLGCYLIFLSMSLESSSYVGSDIFYGFKNFRILGVNLAVWMLIPALLKVAINFRNFKFALSEDQKKVLWLFSIFSGLGVFFGVITWASGDNGFGTRPGSFGVLINTTYTFLMSLVMIIIVFYVVGTNYNRIHLLEEYLFSVVIASAVVFILCFLLGNYGNRGGLDSLQVSEIYVLLIVTPIMFVYDYFDRQSKLLIVLSGLAILFLSLLYNSGGKSIIVLLLMPLVMLYLLRKKGLSLRQIITIIAIIAFAIAILFVILPRLIRDSLLFEIKFKQVLGIINFFSDDWFNSIPDSPKMRLSEFANIVAEFMKKPWFILFGKGFCGTITDNLHLFNNLSTFAFSQWELDTGAYYTMHESINNFFLIGGLTGLYILLRSLKIAFLHINKSPWIIYGLVWILFYYGFHLSIAILGIVALGIGLADRR